MFHQKFNSLTVTLFSAFTSAEIINRFLMSTGYLPVAHEESCGIYEKVLRSKPKWREG